MHEAVMGSQGVMLDTVALQRSRPRALRYRSRSQWYDESCDTKRSHQDCQSQSISVACTDFSHTYILTDLVVKPSIRAFLSG